MGFLVLSLALGFSGIEENAKHVDLIERNHVYDRDGNKFADQIIFYDWSDEKSEYVMVEWWLFPYVTFRQLRDGSYSVTLPHKGSVRVVKSLKFRETWTQNDPIKKLKEHDPYSTTVR